MNDQVKTYDPIGYDGLSALMEECKLGMGGYVRVENYESLSARLAQLEQQTQWISVEAQLPESERTVLAYYLNSHGKGRRVRAEYIAAKTKSADDGWDSDEPADYDEQADEYFWPAGWYEVVDNWDDLTHMVIHEGKVTHWLPLPAAPTP